MQLRDDYRKLRGWLGECQRALDTEDVKEIAARRKVFESVVKNVDAVTKLSPEGETSLQFGFNWLRVVTKFGSPVNSLIRRVTFLAFGAATNRLILAPPGQKGFRKLVSAFGEGHSSRGRELERLFMERCAGA